MPDTPQTTPDTGLFPLGVGKEGYGADTKATQTFLRPYSGRWSASPALHVWLRTVTQEPNWLTVISLPFLENKIKNRECAPLLNITQIRGMGSCILAEGSRKKCSYQSGQDVWEVAGRGATPSNVGLRQPPNTWQKHTFKMKGQDHPSLKGSVLFQLERLTLFPWQILVPL